MINHPVLWFMSRFAFYMSVGVAAGSGFLVGAYVCSKVCAPMSDWQPIETAPKDGSWVLLGGGQHDANTWYGPGPEAPAVVGRWDKGWFFANWDGDYRSEYLIPTHWMPLPVPRSG